MVTPAERLAAAEIKLVEHMATMEYAYAYGHGCSLGDHPTYQRIRAHTEALLRGVRDLRAVVSEHEV